MKGKSRYQFCWRMKDCRRDCPVREMDILFCWRYFAEEGEAGLRPCGECAFRLAWAGGSYQGTMPADHREGPRPKTILVIDDEPNILYALKEAVGDKGYDCISAFDGDTGLTIARCIGPDLVITDVIMPGLGGMELCHALKADPETSDIPVIMVTVKTADRDKLDANLAGADAYITKPFTHAELKKTIERLL